MSIEKLDAVVVGAGLAGLAAAYRLAEAGRQVLVLERGDAPEGLGIAKYLKDVELKDTSGYQEVLTKAMKLQERNVDFLTSLAAMTPTEEVAKIFRAVRNEEAARLRRLEEIYDDEILREG